MTPFSLWKRANGQYYVTVQLPNGKKQYRSLGTKDKQEALARCQSLLHSPNSPSSQNPQTLQDFLLHFGNYHSGIRPSTLVRYVASCKTFLKVVGNKNLSEYTQLDVERSASSSVHIARTVA
jgi:hypothetical protein